MLKKLLLLIFIMILPISALAKKPVNTVIEVDPPTVVEQVVKTGSTLTIYFDHPNLFESIVIAVVHTAGEADALTPLHVGIDDDGDGVIQVFGLERAGRYYITLMAFDKAVDLGLY